MTGSQHQSDKLSSKDQSKLSRPQLRDLLFRVKHGEKLTDELQKSVSDLTNESELYLRISILTWSRLPAFIPVLEKFASYPEDTDVSAIALRGLLNFHYKTAYVPLLEKYIRGVSWDPIDNLKLSAIQIAGEFLSQGANSELLAILIDVYHNPAQAPVQEAAHEALMLAAGEPHSDPSVVARDFSHDDFRDDVIDRLRSRA